MLSKYNMMMRQRATAALLFQCNLKILTSFFQLEGLLPPMQQLLYWKKITTASWTCL